RHGSYPDSCETCSPSDGVPNVPCGYGVVIHWPRYIVHVASEPVPLGSVSLHRSMSVSPSPLKSARLTLADVVRPPPPFPICSVISSSVRPAGNGIWVSTRLKPVFGLPVDSSTCHVAHA